MLKVLFLSTVGLPLFGLLLVLFIAAIVSLISNLFLRIGISFLGF